MEQHQPVLERAQHDAIGARTRPPPRTGPRNRVRAARHGRRLRCRCGYRHCPATGRDGSAAGVCPSGRGLPGTGWPPVRQPAHRGQVVPPGTAASVSHPRAYRLQASPRPVVRATPWSQALPTRARSGAVKPSASGMSGPALMARAPVGMSRRGACPPPAQSSPAGMAGPRCPARGSRAGTVMSAAAWCRERDDSSCSV